MSDNKPASASAREGRTGFNDDNDDAASETPAERNARQMFFAGLLFLPWLWVANLLYFLPDYRAGALSPRTKQWLQRSLVGTVLMTVGFVTWVVYVQVTWKSWAPGTIRALMVSVPDKDESGW